MSIGPGPLLSAAELLLHLSRRVRQAGSAAELRFVLVNETRALALYRQSVLWLANKSQLALSGVVSPEANAPYAQWIQRVAGSLALRADQDPVVVTTQMLEPQDASEWEEWLPAHAVWLPFRHNGAQTIAGGLLISRDTPWQPGDLQLLSEWVEIWWHAYHAHEQQISRGRWFRRSADDATLLAPAPAGSRIERMHATLSSLPRNIRRSPWKFIGMLLLVCALIPVRLTVLAPGELVPAQPAAIRAPLEGTVDRFFVAPNQRVQAGEPLFQLDLTALNSRLAVAQQELATAEAEYRQSAQQAVFEARSKAQLATLQGRISERKTEVSYLESQLQRAQVASPRDGVVLVDDPSEWIGKPVITGEKVMTVADEYDVEVEAWLTPGDVIDLPAGAAVTLYLNSAPLDPVSATLLYAAHEAVARPDGSFAYRVRAQLTPHDAHHRVGLKGTARITGGHVPLVYLMLRRPLAIIRPYIGL